MLYKNIMIIFQCFKDLFKQIVYKNKRLNQAIVTFLTKNIVLRIKIAKLFTMKTLLLLAFFGLSYGLNTNVHLFYYPWYGSPTVSGGGQWIHWNNVGINPP